MADAEVDTGNTGWLGGRGKWIGLAALAIVAAVLLAMWHYSGRESTDDAQIDGHITQVSARVGGTVIAVNIKENQYVEAGAVLAEIDPRDYQVAVERAKAELADARANATAMSTGVPISEVTTETGVRTATGSVEEAQAGIGMAEQQVAAARAQLTSAQARLREHEATALKTARDVERLKGLAAKEEIAQQQYDAAVGAADAARAAADGARSDVVAAEAAIAAAQQRARQAHGAATQASASLRQQSETAGKQLEVTQARADVAEAQVQRAQSTLAQAELNLERTRIVAPAAGIISRKSIEVGQGIQPGQPILALVSLGDVWVTANFKETQLKNMRPGQRATVGVDAVGREFTGHVDSIAAATGAKFSLLPPENATGNYVKVVQRVPVRIVLDAGQDPEHRLRPGMSVAPTVFTK